MEERIMTGRRVKPINNEGGKMSITRNLIMAAAVLAFGAGSSVFAQNGSGGGTYTTRRGGTVTVSRTNSNGQITVNKTATSANGKTVSANKTIDADPSDGTLGRTRTVTDAQGRTRTGIRSATFGNGTLSTSQRVARRDGSTASRQATRGSGGFSVTRTNRNGQVYSRARPRR
jgi:hypothetical protein